MLFTGGDVYAAKLPTVATESYVDSGLKTKLSSTIKYDGEITGTGITAITADENGQLTVTQGNVLIDSVKSGQIATGAVDSGAISDGSIRAIDLDSNVLAPYATKEDLSKKIGTTITDTTTGDFISGIAVGADGNLVITKGDVGKQSLEDGSVTNSKLAKDSVDSEKIINGSITKEDISQDLLDEYATVYEVDLKVGNKMDNKVSGNDSLGNVVTGVELAPDGGLQIIRGDVATDIKLSEGDVTTTEIMDGTIREVDMDKTFMTELVKTQTLSDELEKKLDAVVLSNDGTGMVTDVYIDADTGMLAIKKEEVKYEVADGTITEAKLSDGAVTSTKLADNSVTTDHIINGTIEFEDLNATALENYVTKTQLAQGLDGKVNNYVDKDLTNGSEYVSGMRIENGNMFLEMKDFEFDVDAIKLAEGSVTSTEILDGDVSLDDLHQDVKDLIDSKANGTKVSTFGNGNAVVGLAIGPDGEIQARMGTISAGGGDIVIGDNTITTDEIVNKTILIEDLNDEIINLIENSGGSGGDTKVQVETVGSGNAIVDIFVDSTGKIIAELGNVSGSGSLIIGKRSIESEMIQLNAVTTDEILDDTIQLVDLHPSVRDGFISSDIIVQVEEGETGEFVTDIYVNQNGDMIVTLGDAPTGSGGTFELTDRSVENIHIALNAITTDLIKNGTIKAEDLDAEVLADYITATDLNNYVTQGDLDEYITSTELSNYNYVTEAELGDYVTDPELQAGLNTRIKTTLGSDGSTGNVITGLSVGSDGTLVVSKSDVTASDFQLEDGSVTTAKIRDEAVTMAKLSTEVQDAINDKFEMPAECTTEQVVCVLASLANGDPVWTKIYTDAQGN